MNGQTSNINLKPLPYNVTRGDIKTMYNHLSEEFLMNSLNVITQNYCEATKVPFKRYYKVPRPVWVEFICANGFPANYKHENDWLEEKTF